MVVCPQPPRIAVVGSGVSALSATRALAQLSGTVDSALYGASVSLFTSRSKFTTQMGPRNQTPPKQGAPFFDYACQYITADVPWFEEELQRWIGMGAASALPHGSVGTLTSSGFMPLSSGPCVVGNGGMWPMMTLLLEETAKSSAHVDLVSGFPDERQRVIGLSRQPEGWKLATKSGGFLGPFDVVVGGFAQHVLTEPFLLSGGEHTAAMLRCLRRVEHNQIIAMQVAFEGPPLPTQFTAAHCDDEVLSFVCNNSRKPHQDGSAAKEAGETNEHWTLLSTAGFAERQFRNNNKGYRAKAEVEMLSSFGRLLNVDIRHHRPRVNRINHWEDALPVVTPPTRQGCLFDSAVGLGWCGDFCVSPNAQGGALSGRAMASVVERYVGHRQLPEGLLPADEPWAPIKPPGPSVDIGAFAHPALPSRSTHDTGLVSSAIGGYSRPGSASLKTAGGHETPRGDRASPQVTGNSKGRGRRGKGGGRGRAAAGRGA